MLLPSEIGDQSQQVTNNNLMGAAHGNTTFNKRARDELFERLFHYTTVPRTIRWEPPLGELHIFFWKYRSDMWVECKGEFFFTIGSSPTSFWRQEITGLICHPVGHKAIGTKGGRLRCKHPKADNLWLPHSGRGHDRDNKHEAFSAGI